MYAFKTVLIFLGLWPLLVFLSGCSVDSPMERPAENDQGPFYVRSFTGELRQTVYDKDHGMPRTRVFDFKICLNDLAMRKQMIDYPFSIEGGKSIVKKKTDKNGCLVWTESIDFNFLAKSRYVAQKRTIRSLGMHQGFDVVEFALNPWRRSEDEQAIYDLKLTKNVPALVSARSAKETLLARNSKDVSIWIEELDFANVNEGRLTVDGYSSEIELHLSPVLRMKDINGNWKIHPIKRGKFRVRPYIINRRIMKDGVKERQVFSLLEGDAESEISHNGLLKTVSKINIPLIPTRGDLELGLIVSPINKRKAKGLNIKPFHGVFLYGKIGDLVGNHAGKLKRIVDNPKGKHASGGQTFDLSKYVDLNASFVSKYFNKFRKGNGKSFSLPCGWQVNKYFFKKLDIEFQNYSNMVLPKQSVIFHVTSCVKNMFSKENLTGYKMTIHQISRNSDGSRKKVFVKTDPDGCFTWTDSIRYTVYDKEHYILEDFYIENEQLNIKERLEIAINPWDFGFTFGRDARYTPLLGEQQNTDKKPPSEIWLPGFGYKDLGFDYKIDKYLNLTVQKHLLVRIDPFFKAYHSITRVRPIYPLFPGKYLLRLVLMRNFYEDPYHAGEYISHVEKLVEVFKGRILTTATFDIDNIRLMGSRNVILAEVLTIDESKVIKNEYGQIIPKDRKLRDKPELWDEQLVSKDSGLVSRPYVGVITLLDKQGSSDFLPMSNKTRINSMNETQAAIIMASNDGSVNVSEGAIDRLTQFANPVPETTRAPDQRHGGSHIRSKEGKKLNGFHETDPRARVLRTDNAAHGVFPLRYANVHALGDKAVQKKLAKILNCGIVINEVGKEKEVCLDLSSGTNGQKRESDEKESKSLLELVTFHYHDDRTNTRRIGYLPPKFYIKTSQMISRGTQSEKVKKAEIKDGARLENYLQDNNLMHIDLSNPDSSNNFLQALANPLRHLNGREGYDKYMEDRKNFWDNILQFSDDENNARDILYSSEKIHNFIDNGEMDEELISTLCDFWYKDLLRNTVSSSYPFVLKKGYRRQKVTNIFEPRPNDLLAEHCKKTAKEGPNHAFVTSRKLRVKELKGFSHQKGLSINMSIGNNVQWGYFHNNRKEKLTNFSIGAGANVPGIDLFGLSLGGSANKSKVFMRGSELQNALSNSDSTAVNLVVQRNEFVLFPKKFEKCISVKLNPLGLGLYDNEQNVLKIKNKTVLWNKNLSQQDRINLSSRGLFICTGKDVEETIKINEYYYYITQHFNVGHFIDTKNIKNRWFDLALRGQQTFTTFASLLYAQQYKMIKGERNYTPVAREEVPLEALLPVYQNIPNSTYGIYTLPGDANGKEFFDWTL